MKSKFQKNHVVKILIFGITVVFLNSFISFADNPPKDEKITFWVKEVLRSDPRIMDSGMKVVTKDGIVTLSGTAWTLAEKKYAELESQKIKGVQGVVDQIDVKTIERADNDIAQDIKQRLINSSVVHSDNIGVAVDKGSVMLTGNVDSEAESNHAELVTGEVRGVNSIENDLIVEFKKTRPDDEIKNDIVDSIHHDVYFSDLPITVSVKNGVVTLEGTVGSAYEKRRAEERAYVDNVKKVKNKLTVLFVIDNNVRNKPPVMSDKELEKAVKDELYQDLHLKEPYKITVEAYYGQITLNGTVPTLYDKYHATKDALGILGVGWVNNVILVQPASRKDSSIFDDVRTSLKSDYSLSDKEITVKVDDGVVTLAGHVNIPQEKEHATELMCRIKGVKELNNNISIIPLFEYDDKSLTDNVKNRLASNAKTMFIADEIGVTVKDGIALLSGKVNNWTQWHEAEQIVFLTQGIRGVSNKLTVADYQYPWEELFQLNNSHNHS